MTRDRLDPDRASPAEAARYTLRAGERFEWTSATRHDGRDLQLDRPVRAWVLATPDPAEHEVLLHIARVSSRLTSAAFLRVVDALPEADRLVVILEAPESPIPHGALPDEHELVRDLAEGLREASTAGLQLHRLPQRLFEERARLDPIELFLPTAGGALDGQSVGAQLRAAVVEAVDHGAVASGSPLEDLGEDWRRPDPERSGALEEVLDALERATSRGRGGRQDWPPLVEEADGVFVSDEPTVPLPHPRAEASTGPPAAPPTPPGPGVLSLEEPSPALARPRPSPMRVARPRGRAGTIALAIVSVVAAGGVLAVSAAALSTRAPAQPPEATTTTSEASAPQAVPGQVLVILRTQEDTYVRAAVDGTVLFDGTMRSGESRSWQGRQRVQVFTNKGRSALISINGYELGPYSPAMGHPDWNQIDFGFGPDWRP